MTNKPNVGDKVRYSYASSSGTLLSTEGEVHSEGGATGIMWSREGHILFDPFFPERTTILERAFPTAKVVLFHDAWDGGKWITEKYAIRTDDGYYMTTDRDIVDSYDKVVSYEVIVP